MVSEIVRLLDVHVMSHFENPEPLLSSVLSALSSIVSQDKVLFEEIYNYINKDVNEISDRDVFFLSSLC
jgi:hypothetical protein